MLRAEGISKFYPRKAALKGVSVQFPERGMVFIRGVSGSGKSTLMNILTASDYPDEGKVIYNGVEITKENAESYRRSCVSEIYQDFLLLDDMSVKDNIAFAMQAAGGKADEDIIKDILAKVGLLDCAGENAIKLSGGEKQRVAIARAIVKQDAMIFADEPTGNLDSGNAKAVMDILKDISGQRLVVVVSHNEAQSREYADMIIDISDGEIIGNTAIDVPEDIDENSGGWSAKKDGTDGKAILRLAKFNLGSGALKSVIMTLATCLMCIITVFLMTLAIDDTPWAYTVTLQKAQYKNAEFELFWARPEDSPENAVKEKIIEDCKHPVNYGYNVDAVFEIGGAADNGIKLAKLVATKDDKSFDLDILYGAYPSKPMQILIPSSAADKILALLDKDGNKIFATQQEIIGRHFLLYEYGLDSGVGMKLEICGIFDDGFHPDDKLLSDKKKYKDDLDYLNNANNMKDIALGCYALCDILLDYISAFDSEYAFSINGNKLIKSLVIGYNDAMPYSSYLAPLQTNQAYVSRSAARLYNLQQGDTVNIRVEVSRGEQTKYDTASVTIKEIVDDGLIGADMIMNSYLYRYMYLRGDVTNQPLAIARSVWINCRGIQPYPLFRHMSKLTKSVNLINTEGAIGDYEDFRATLITLSVAAVIALAALQCGAVNYLISSKDRQFNVLRVINFGRNSVCSIMLLQALVISLLQSVIGITLAGVLCLIISRWDMPSVATQYTLPMGWHAALVAFVISIAAALLAAVVKCKSLFAKSIIDSSKTGE